MGLRTDGKGEEREKEKRKDERKEEKQEARLKEGRGKLITGIWIKKKTSS